jgi:hypothetical protein
MRVRLRYDVIRLGFISNREIPARRYRSVPSSIRSVSSIKVYRYFFGHVTVEKLLRKAFQGEIALAIVGIRSAKRRNAAQILSTLPPTSINAARRRSRNASSFAERRDDAVKTSPSYARSRHTSFGRPRCDLRKPMSALPRKPTSFSPCRDVRDVRRAEVRQAARLPRNTPTLTFRD